MIIKKFTAIQIDASKINNNLSISLNYGKTQGPYYEEVDPTTEFDTEDEAVKYAEKFDKYATWLILPIVRFTHEFSIEKPEPPLPPPDRILKEFGPVPIPESHKIDK